MNPYSFFLQLSLLFFSGIAQDTSSTSNSSLPTVSVRKLKKELVNTRKLLLEITAILIIRHKADWVESSCLKWLQPPKEIPTIEHEDEIFLNNSQRTVLASSVVVDPEDITFINKKLRTRFINWMLILNNPQHPSAKNIVTSLDRKSPTFLEKKREFCRNVALLHLYCGLGVHTWAVGLNYMKFTLEELIEGLQQSALYSKSFEKTVRILFNE